MIKFTILMAIKAISMVKNAIFIAKKGKVL
jgi:hypothetical protein